MNRGIRQGCPISALLYLFVAEILSLKLKSNNEMKGINISNMQKDIKNNQHADGIYAGTEKYKFIKYCNHNCCQKSTLAKHNSFY